MICYVLVQEADTHNTASARSSESSPFGETRARSGNQNLGLRVGLKGLWLLDVHLFAEGGVMLM